jgi:DNA-binding response OmpR family regulator
MTTSQKSPMPEHEKKSSATKQYHVLIVDDDREIIEMLRRALADEGFNVSVATDGNQGVAYVEAKNPDLVILDMMMPRRSGFLVLERLRQYYAKSVPVIMITGNEGTRHREYAEMLGVSDYIHKPFAMDRLLSSVNNILKT